MAAHLDSAQTALRFVSQAVLLLAVREGSLSLLLTVSPVSWDVRLHVSTGGSAGIPLLLGS